MKIMRYSAENIKGIKVVEIQPNGDVVTLSGKNGAGKSTILDSIERTLCGGSLPLSNGEDNGKVEINIGDYTVSRIITKKTDRLVVKNQDGATYPSPRTFLKKFIGPLSIDPLSFVRMKDRDQLDVIFRLNPELKEALEAADNAIEMVKEQRSDVWKEKKRLDVEFENAPYHGDLPAELVSVADLSKSLEKAREHNTGIENLEKEKRDCDLEIDKNHEQIKTLKEGIKGLKEQIETLVDKNITYSERISEIDETLQQTSPVDAIEILTQISDAEETNEKIRQNQEAEKLKTAREQKGQEYSELGQALKQAEQDKADLLKNAKMPIDGLSVNGKGVTYNGVPMTEICTAERVRVGASVAISQNPEAKIILVDDVSLLDSDNLNILHETCKDFQIWQVVNDDSGDMGFYIEEGEIKEAKGDK